MVHISKDQPATYEIHVNGRLDKSWSDRLSDMAISTVENETHLIGELADQAALMGILNTLYMLGLSLILVHRQR